MDRADRATVAPCARFSQSWQPYFGHCPARETFWGKLVAVWRSPHARYDAPQASYDPPRVKTPALCRFRGFPLVTRPSDTQPVDRS